MLRREASGATDTLNADIIDHEISPLDVLFVTARVGMLKLLVSRAREQSLHFRFQAVPLIANAVRSVIDAVNLDAVVVDVGDTPTEAIKICRIVRERQPNVPVVPLLCCNEPTSPSHVRDMLKSGVSGFVDSRAEPSSIFEAIGRLQVRGAMYIQLHDRRRMLETLMQAQVETGPPVEPLRQTQKVLVRLVAQGLTNREIGKILHLAPSTVHHQVGELCGRLGIRNRVALAAWAGANGFLRPAQPAVTS
jgi:DNA-binding NarL/FixJ family response regulator